MSIQERAPSLYIPMRPQKPEFGKDNFSNNSASAQGKQFVSNQANFLLEVMKLIPHAEAEIYEEGVQFDGEGDFKSSGDQESPPAKQALDAITNIERKYKYEFSANGLQQANGFGFVHSQAERQNASYMFLGQGGGQYAKSFNYTPAFYDFYHGESNTQDIARAANFFMSKSELSNKNNIRSDGDIGGTPIPVYSPEEADKSNVYQGKGTNPKNLYATDYNTLFFGNNPSLLVGDKLPNIASYDDGLFKAAQSFFRRNIYTFSDYKTDGINRDRNDSPSFYQIAMDPTAPWNSTKTFPKSEITGIFGQTDNSWQSFFVNSSSDSLQFKQNLNESSFNTITDGSKRASLIAKWKSTFTGTWYQGKNFGEIAFNMAILMLESRRRYFAGMTQLVGPHTQYAGYDIRENRSASNYDDNAGKISLDKLMINNQDRWLKESAESPWLAKETGSINTMMFQTFVGAQHRLSQEVYRMGAGSSGTGSWDSPLENASMTKFRNWMIANLDSFKGTYTGGHRISTTVATFNVSNDFSLTKFQTANTKTDRTDDPDTEQNETSTERTVAFRPIQAEFDRIKGLLNGITLSVDESNKISSYNLKKMIMELSSIKQSLNGIQGISGMTTNEQFNDALKKVNDAKSFLESINTEISNLNGGSSYEQMKNELFYVDDGTNAHFNLQPQSFINYNDTKYASWDYSEGHFITDLQLDGKGYDRTPGTYNLGNYVKTAGNTFTNSRLAHISGQHHFYSPAQALNNMPAFFKNYTAKLDVEDHDSNSSIIFYKYGQGTSFDVGGNITGQPNVYEAKPYEKIWMSHFYGDIIEKGYSAMFMERTVTSMINDASKFDYRKKAERYEESQEEAFEEKREDAKIEAKQVQKKRELDKVKKKK